MTATLERPAVAGSNDPRQPWRPGPKGVVARLSVFAVIGLVLVAAPLLVPDVQVNLVSRAFVFGIIALSMNVLTGYVGTVSLGHQAFVGVGAFTAGFVLTDLGLPWTAAMLVAIGLGALQAALIGVVALRVQGFFFAIVTLAYGLFAKDVLFNISALTGGGAGQTAPRPALTTITLEQGETFEGVVTSSVGHAQDVRYAWLCLACLVLVWLFDWRLTSSRGGRAIQALRDDPRVAASWGINVKGFTLLAFAISGAMAGLAGALFASIETFVSAESFTLSAALIYVLMTTVGGIGSRPGVVQGGFVFAALGPVLTALHDTPGWGRATQALGDSAAIGVCSSTAARGVAVALALMLVVGAAEAVRHLVLGKDRPGWQRVVGGVVALATVAAGAVVGFGVFGTLGGYCIFTSISVLLEPVIGVVLLLLTLIAFPGGIAEQQAPILRWLSFGRFHGDRSSTVGIGAATDDSTTHQ